MKTSYLLSLIFIFAAFYHCQTLAQTPNLLQGQASNAKFNSRSAFGSQLKQSSSPITQTGTVSKTYYGTGHAMQSGAASTRTDDITVTFNQVFSSIPSVGVALQGLDMDYRVPSVGLQVVGVTIGGFVLRVTAKPNVYNYFVQVGYIATLSQQSGIYIVDHSIDAASDSQVSQTLNANNYNAKIVTKSIAAPCLANLKSATFIRSFDITARGNTRFWVYSSSDSSSLNYYTWYDTLLNSAATTTVFWSGNDASISKIDLQSSQNGILLNGATGEQNESVKYSTTNYQATPEQFYGLTLIDIQTGRNIRVKQNLSGSNSGWTLTMTRWWDTQIYQVKDSVITACTSNSKCTK